MDKQSIAYEYKKQLEDLAKQVLKMCDIEKIFGSLSKFYLIVYKDKRTSFETQQQEVARVLSGNKDAKKFQIMFSMSERSYFLLDFADVEYEVTEEAIIKFNHWIAQLFILLDKIYYKIGKIPYLLLQEFKTATYNLKQEHQKENYSLIRFCDMPQWIEQSKKDVEFFTKTANNLKTIKWDYLVENYK